MSTQDYRDTAEKLWNNLGFDPDIKYIEAAFKEVAREARLNAIDEVKSIFLDNDYDEACAMCDAISSRGEE